MGILDEDYLRAATVNPNIMRQGILSRTKPPMQMNPLTTQGLLDGAALATSPVPILGDIVGLGADANRFITDPSSRTPANFGLAALGLLPFIPPISAAKKAKNVVFNSVSDDPRKWALKNSEDLTGFSEIHKNADIRLLHKPEMERGAPNGFGEIFAVNKNGEVVGSTYYGPHGASKGSSVLEGAVEVRPDHRRKGIATAMYDSIESITGKKMMPADSNSPLAAAFWESRNSR